MERLFAFVSCPVNGWFTQQLQIENESDRTFENHRSLVPSGVKNIHYFTALGRIMAKCLVEGVRIPLALNSMCLDVMMHPSMTRSSNVDALLAGLEETSVEEATLYRNILRTRQSKAPFPMEIGQLLGTSSEQFVTDANKVSVVSAAIWKKVILDRQPQLEAMAQGFGPLTTALEACSGHQLSLLFYGTRYIVTADIESRFVWSKGCWPSNTISSDLKQWFHDWIRQVSDLTLRWLLCRLQLPFESENCIYIIPSSNDKVTFTTACQIGLPLNCTSAEALYSRLQRALLIAEENNMWRSGEERRSVLSQIEFDRVIEAMKGEIKSGGWYKCPKGHLYCVGECGGPMQQSICPECKSIIGSPNQNHEIASGNQHANVDKSTKPAWPQ